MILKNTYQTLWIYLVIITVVVIYASTLTAEPLTWNDDTVISILDAIKNGNASIWNNPIVRPIPLAVFSFLYSFGDGSIFLFHLVNIIAHTSNIVLLFFILARYQQSFGPAIIVSALFGVHTMHAGTVAWISQFPILLSLTILLMAALAYSEYSRTEKFLHMLLVGLLAVVFHFVVVGGLQFLIMLFGIDLVEGRKFSKKGLYQKIPFVVLSIASIFVSHVSFINLYFDSVQFLRFGVIEGIVKFVTFAPQSGVTSLQELIEKNLFLGYSIYPLLVPFIISIVFWFGRDQKIVLFSFFGFVLFGLPLFSCSEGGEWLLNAERYYISSIFILILISVFVNRHQELLKRNKKLMIAIISIAIVTMGCISFQTNQSLNNRQTNLSFWTNLEHEHPKNAFILNKMGSYHFSKYEIERAISNFSMSINYHPDNFESYNNRGLVYLHMYLMDSAKTDFLKAIKLFPDYALAFYNLSTANSILSEWDKAVENSSKAIELQPGFVQAYNNRANTYAKQKKYVQAFADYETALRIDPKYSEIYGNRALISLETGNATDAIRDFKSQSDLVPHRFDVLIHLGLTYIIVGDTTAAILEVSHAGRLDSANAKMYLSAVQNTFLRGKTEKNLLTTVFQKIDSLNK